MPRTVRRLFAPLPAAWLALVPLLGIPIHFLLPAALASAQEVRLTGQLRPRFEDRSPEVPSAPAGDVTMRVRVGVDGYLPEELRFRVEFQDVLVWGGASDRSGPGSGAEVHQAFVELPIPGGVARLRMGRQEMPLGNQRLVSVNNWGQRARRFDGLRLLSIVRGSSADVFSIRLADPGPSGGPDGWFHGLHIAPRVPEGDSLSLYILHDRERRESGDRVRTTFGGHAARTFGGIQWLVESWAQRGRLGTDDLSAHMVSLGARIGWGGVRVTGAWDRYSGDREPKDVPLHTFDRLFGTNHRVHGYADVFRRIPEDTGGRGLHDVHLRTQIPMGPRAELQVNAHLFRSVEGRESTIADVGQRGSNRFGEELDLVLGYRAHPGWSIEGGASRLFAGPALEDIRRLDRNLTFVYLMATVVF